MTVVRRTKYPKAPLQVPLEVTQTAVEAKDPLARDVRCLDGHLAGEAAFQACALVTRVVSRLQHPGPHILQFCSLDASCRNVISRQFCLAATDIFKTVLLVDAGSSTADKHGGMDEAVPDSFIPGLYHARIVINSIDVAFHGLSSLSRRLRTTGLSIDLTVVDTGYGIEGSATHMARSAISGTVLVAKGGSATKRQLIRTTAAIRTAGGAVLGVVFVNPSVSDWLLS